MTRQAIVFPWPAKALSPNSRGHWSKKSQAAKAYRKACFVIALEFGFKVDWAGDVHLWLTFFPPDKRQRDDDNLIAAFKSGRDGLADALKIDDKRFRLHPWVSDQVRPGGCVEAVMTTGPEHG